MDCSAIPEELGNVTIHCSRSLGVPEREKEASEGTTKPICLPRLCVSVCFLLRLQ